MTTKPDKVWTQQDVTTELARTLSLIEPILEAVEGYRARCLAAGFNETAAEVMALDLHRMLMGGGAK